MVIVSSKVYECLYINERGIRPITHKQYIHMQKIQHNSMNMHKGHLDIYRNTKQVSIWTNRIIHIHIFTNITRYFTNITRYYVKILYHVISMNKYYFPDQIKSNIICQTVSHDGKNSMCHKYLTNLCYIHTR